MTTVGAALSHGLPTVAGACAAVMLLAAAAAAALLRPGHEVATVELAEREPVTYTRIPATVGTAGGHDRTSTP